VEGAAGGGAVGEMSISLDTLMDSGLGEHSAQVRRTLHPPPPPPPALAQKCGKCAFHVSDATALPAPLRPKPCGDADGGAGRRALALSQRHIGRVRGDAGARLAHALCLRDRRRAREGAAGVSLSVRSLTPPRGTLRGASWRRASRGAHAGLTAPSAPAAQFAHLVLSAPRFDKDAFARTIKDAAIEDEHRDKSRPSQTLPAAGPLRREAAVALAPPGCRCPAARAQGPASRRAPAMRPSCCCGAWCGGSSAPRVPQTPPHPPPPCTNWTRLVLPPY